MSTDTNMSADSESTTEDEQTQEREVARRVFARELNDATYQFKESSAERAPKYSLSPTGAKANRVFISGTVVEVEDVGEDNEYWRAKISDGSGVEEDNTVEGNFFAYAGQYQPEAVAALQDLETPEYVTIVGKPRVYETDDGNTNVSIRPETVNVVDESTRERWIVETAEQTQARIEQFEEGGSAYAEMAAEEYVDQDIDKYREGAVAALNTVVDDAE